MAQSKAIILWDFDGTLAFRAGMWRSALMEALDMYQPGHNIDVERIRPYLRDGFPWHQPEQPHHHLSTPEKWWSHVESILTRAFQGVGFDMYRAEELARLAHERYIDPATYNLFNDTIPALAHLSQCGWEHIILSNHIPELPQIVKTLPLSHYITYCISSASIGYEKPNPEAFRIALSLCGNPETVWMIGDDPVADVRGAETVGLPAILVRNAEIKDIRYHADDLPGAASIIESHPKDR